MNKPVYLALLILLINEIAIYEFSYDYMKLKYEEKAQLCYANIYSFIACISTEDIYGDI